jgi:hypothetical protein
MLRQLVLAIGIPQLQRIRGRRSRLGITGIELIIVLSLLPGVAARVVAALVPERGNRSSWPQVLFKTVVVWMSSVTWRILANW